MTDYRRRLAVVATLFVFSLGLGMLVTQEGGRIPLRPDQVAQATGIYDLTWSPDGKSIAYIGSGSEGFDVWTVSSTGGQTRRLTTTRGFKKQPRWSRDGRWIAYVAIQNNGNGDIHVVAGDGNSTTSLAGTSADESNPAWAPSSQEIAFTERSADGPRIVSVNVQTRERRELADMDATDLEWSPDGKNLAFVADPLQPRDNRRVNEDIFIASADGGGIRLLTPGTPRFRESSPSWSPDSRRIAYASEDTGFSNIYIVDTQSGDRRPLTSGKVDNLSPKWSPDGSSIGYVRNENFQFHIFTIAVTGGVTYRMSDRDGVNGGFSHINTSSPDQNAPYGSFAWAPDSTRIAFTHSDPARPSDIWVRGKTGERAFQLTNSMPQELRRESRFVWPELLNYRSFDGQEVTALIYKPRISKPSSGHPALLAFRDSLDGQHSFSWDPFIQFLVSNGYVVFAPNVRGSSGRGHDYRQLVAGNGGDHDVRDAYIGLDRLSSEGLIDNERLGVFGAGTGGFLATASLIRDEARFKAAVCLYGIVDTVTATSYPSMTEWSRYMIGSVPIENAMAFFERSLINFIDKLRTPVVFLYAGQDTSAPFQQLQQFAVQAEVKGKWYDYQIFEGELGDWRSWQPGSIRLSLEAMDALFAKHLLGKDREIRLSRNR